MTTGTELDLDSGLANKTDQHGVHLLFKFEGGLSLAEGLQATPKDVSPSLSNSLACAKNYYTPVEDTAHVITITRYLTSGISACAKWAWLELDAKSYFKSCDRVSCDNRKNVNQ